MKKVISLFLLSFIIFSCSNDNKETITQETTQNENFQPKSNLCPEGSVEVWSYSFNYFRFKRPKYSCERGFWFCSDGEWTFDGCRDLTTGEFHSVEDMILELDLRWTALSTGGKAKVAAYPSIGVPNELTLQFPVELMNEVGYGQSEVDTLNVDEEIFIGSFQLKGGDYPTKITSKYIVAKVPTY